MIESMVREKRRCSMAREMKQLLYAIGITFWSTSELFDGNHIFHMIKPWSVV